MEAIYTERFFLSAGETNPEQELSTPLLVSKLIDIATAHANSLGIGNPAMAHLEAGWVLARLTVEMNRWPRVNTDYSISTWVVDFNRHYSERAFCIRDGEGNICGYANSIWMVMHTRTHANLGLSHLSLDPSLLRDRPPIEKQAKHCRILLPEEKAERRPADLDAAQCYGYTFKYCDLDSYRHVNTVRYVILLLNCFTLSEHDETRLHRLELSFLHEARYGEATQLLRSDAPDNPLHSSFLLRRASDGEALMFARLYRESR